MSKFEIRLEDFLLFFLSPLLGILTTTAFASPTPPAKLYSLTSREISGGPDNLANGIVTGNLLFTPTKSEYSETIRYGLISQESGFFDSPWEPSVKKSIEGRIEEMLKSNPSATSLIVDLGLSSRNILGFSDKARIKSIQDIGVDPLDLNLLNRADDEDNERVSSWANWRVEQVEELLKDIVAFAKARSPRIKVFAFGDAGYYTRQESHALREASDWAKWLKDGVVDGVLVRGHWAGRYNDVQVFSRFYKQFSSRKSDVKLKIIPVSNGKNLVRDSTYGRDWAVLREYVPSLNTLVCEIKDAEDVNAIHSLKEGKVVLSAVARPQIGSLMPTALLREENNEAFDWSKNFPQSSLALLLVPQHNLLSPSSSAAISLQVSQLAQKNVKLRYIEQKFIPSDPENWRLIDENRDLLAHFPNALTLLQTDESGFVRSIVKMNAGSLATKLSQIQVIHPALEIGKEAPEFALTDMNGDMRRLSSLRGKKNLLLTFFPKCFTGQCSNHLTSLRDKKAEFDALDTEIWAVSVDPGDVQIDFSNQWKFNFPLIPDTGRNLCFLYGAARNISELADRMSVFIDKNGVVQWIDRDVHVSTHGPDVIARIEH